MANKKGIEISFKKRKNPEKFLFGEDQSRYLLVINKKKEIENLAKKNKIEFERIGVVTGAFLNFKNLFSISVDALLKLNSSWFKVLLNEIIVRGYRRNDKKEITRCKNSY